MVDLYAPRPVEIREIEQETEDTRTFRLSFRDPEERSAFRFSPGQFVMLSVLGVGEAAFSLCSDPGDEDISTTIRKVGRVTDAIFALKEGDVIGVRGPYGVGWPMDEVKESHVLLVAGGIGLPPLRPVITQIAANRLDYGGLEILYGARTPGDQVFTYEYESWRKIPDCRLLLTVDTVPEGVRWQHKVGVVTTLFDDMKTDASNSLVMTCGPEIMMRFVVRGLMARGFTIDRIYVSMERRMKCGVGKCGHCQMGGTFVCKDGPVFSYRSIEGLPDKIV